MKVLTLEDFFTILRHQGLNVGVREYTQLQTIFKTQPALDRAALFELFCTVLAKNEAERTIIRRAFNAYLPEEKENTALDNTGINDQALFKLDTETKKVTNNDDPTPLEEEEKLTFWQQQAKTIRERWPYLLGLVVLLMATVIFFADSQQETITDKTTKNPALQTDKHDLEIKEPEYTEQTAKPLKLVKEVEVWTVESTTIVTRDKTQALFIPLLLFASAGLAFFWLLGKVLHKSPSAQSAFS